MSTCIYCGKSAGLFRTQHAGCEAARQRIISEAGDAIRAEGNFDAVDRRVLAEVRHTTLVPTAVRRCLVTAWEQSVEKFLKDGVLDAVEENRLAKFKEHFGLAEAELDKNGALTRTVKAGILREVLSGSIPQRASFDEPLPINLQNGERIVWAFGGSQYLEDKVRREYIGRSQHVSVRLMQGVYYGVGAFKGHPVEHTERVLLDTGLVVVTGRNLYFAGPKKSLRIPYVKIVSFEPFSNGIGLTRDAATAKAQIFVTGDGWFTYNLVTNLARIHAPVA